MNLDFKEYIEKCKQRWSGEFLRDAKQNWHAFQELKVKLVEELKSYRENPFQKDSAGKCHNPNGTLTDFLWNLQSAWQPDKSRFDPFIDFEEHFQKCFLRRGLIIFCSMILRELETKHPNPDQAVLNL